MESIISALVAGGLALIGVIITNISNNQKIERQLMTAQAVTDTKIDNLTNELRKHTVVVDKIPVIENRLDHLEQDVRELKER